MGSRKDDPVFNVKFVQLVESKQCLWNSTLPEYSKKDEIQKAWQDVANETKDTVRNCRERWRTIRSSFLRSLKLSRTSTGRGKRKYYLSKYLQFLIPYTKTRLKNSASIIAQRKAAAAGNIPPMTRISNMPMPIVSSDDTKDSTNSTDIAAMPTDADVVVTLHEAALAGAQQRSIVTSGAAGSNVSCSSGILVPIPLPQPQPLNLQAIKQEKDIGLCAGTSSGLPLPLVSASSLSAILPPPLCLTNTSGSGIGASGAGGGGLGLGGGSASLTSLFVEQHRHMLSATTTTTTPGCLLNSLHSNHGSSSNNSSGVQNLSNNHQTHSNNHHSSNSNQNPSSIPTTTSSSSAALTFSNFNTPPHGLQPAHAGSMPENLRANSNISSLSNPAASAASSLNINTTATSGVDFQHFTDWIKCKNEYQQQQQQQQQQHQQQQQQQHMQQQRNLLISPLASTSPQAAPDADQSFLNSLHPFLKEMSGKQNRRFRQKVVALIDAVLDNAD